MYYGRVRLQGAEFTALYTPTFRISLLSIGQLDIAGYISTFGNGVYEISSGDHVISGKKRGNLYLVEADPEVNATAYTSELRAETEPQTEPQTEPPSQSEGRNLKRRKKRKRSIATATATIRPGPKTASESKL